LVYAAEGVSILDHCRVEHAFTGLQVHFSQAKITNSSFRGNQEGIRFGRAELTIEHNDFDANRYGIRHTRLEGPVLIQYNSIRRNEVGIFLVPSNQNVVNFEDTFSVKEGPAPYQPVVRFNSLVGNREYAYKFGERQGYDIDLRDNWWGSVSERSIRAGIYDGNDDPTLGKAGIAPFLRSPAQGVGPRKEGAL
ncbi:MAG: right-handed parallel beta-helix repeat-containing protein, partial [Geobacter sp.]|nr:right-handed parallel beta-helix repeat-containing protein [Geobacter sp.]